MNKATLVVMAAGMGSRYGGTKQVDSVDNNGYTIMDYSIYDAIKAGFDKIVFVIKPEIMDYVESVIGARIRRYADVSYVFQKLETLPKGYKVPKGRKKPWGTGHATLCALKQVEGSFAVINSDDFYGSHAYKLCFDYITKSKSFEHCMVGYLLKNAVTDNGYVSRGVCSMDENDFLKTIVETLHIEKRNGGIEYTEDDGKTYSALDPDTIVSMNMWGFGPDFADAVTGYFPAFLDKALSENPLKGEYFLPSIVENVIRDDAGSFKVIPTEDKWFGVTYKEDKQTVVDAIKELKQLGLYPDDLWHDRPGTVNVK